MNSKNFQNFLYFVVQVGLEPTVAEVRSDLPSLFIPRLLSPIHKGFFCTIVGLTGLEPITEGPKSSVLPLHQSPILQRDLPLSTEAYQQSFLLAISLLPRLGIEPRLSAISLHVLQDSNPHLLNLESRVLTQLN